MCHRKKYRPLVIFDFDETLVKTGARIFVRSKNLHLTPQEYLNYCIKYNPTFEDRDDLDFSEFDQKDLVEPVQPLYNQIRILRRRVREVGVENVIILSARMNSSPIKMFKKRFNIPNVRVYAVANSSPLAKQNVVESLIKKKKYTHIFMYDDSKNNLSAIFQACQKVGVKTRLYHVRHSYKHPIRVCF